MNRPGMHAANGQERVRLADFTVRSTISKGSFGTVYKVVRKADNRVYALKQIEIEGMNRAEREETIDEVCGPCSPSCGRGPSPHARVLLLRVRSACDLA
mmetsp:Transcript_69851/g.221294  ORF Transcript_69851/g.221294 Transcript_69851/m.221294 type:complete len:99 (-) Transcript_69851:1429-1725(-)